MQCTFLLDRVLRALAKKTLLLHNTEKKDTEVVNQSTEQPTGHCNSNSKASSRQGSGAAATLMSLEDIIVPSRRKGARRAAGGG
jgi:hypothetical protein